MTVIIDYGVGNLFSLSSSLSHLGVQNKISGNAQDLIDATRIILPGVGAFGDAMQKLQATGLVPVLKQQVQQGKPLLGICLGMQILFETSEEYGIHTGLGFIKGNVASMQNAFIAQNIALKVPHMGWNALQIKQPNNLLLQNVNEGDCVYFVHSFYATQCENSVVAHSQYGVSVPATVANGNVYGCQFHPEKSGGIGLQILSNFCSLT